MRSNRCPLLVGLGLGLVSTLAAPAAWADQIGEYSQRSLTLGKGTFRIDGGPVDFGYFHPSSPQWLNENRGVRIQKYEQPPGVYDNADPNVWLGAGLAYGITDDIELGGLVLPLQVADELDFDDMEAYGRFRFLRRRFEMGAQVTLQIPVETDFALGLGLPMLAHVGRKARIDTGFELEMIFGEEADDGDVFSLDVPFAMTWDIGQRGFLGFRTGLYVWNMEDVVIPAGMHGGVVVANGKLDIAPWFMWPVFMATGREDELVHVKSFELGVGFNGRIP